MVAMEIAAHDTMQFVMYSSTLPNMPPWLPRKRLPVWCPVPICVLLISCSHTGAMVALLPWMSVLYQSPLQHLTLAGAASSPGHVLRVCVRRKMSSNLPACRSAGVDFLPIVVETLGWWCPDAITAIRSIGEALGQRLNSTDPVHSTKHLFGRLAVALWWGNAALWMHRQPTLSPFLDGVL